jgi:DNA polymerase-4
VGAENTFDHDTNDMDFLHSELRLLSTTVCKRLEKYQLKGKTVTLKLKFADFKQITRSHSMNFYTNNMEELYLSAVKLLNEIDLSILQIRLIGVTLSNFDRSVELQSAQNIQLELDL